MSTFTGPPPIRVLSRSGRTLGRPRRGSPELSTGGPVVHRSAVRGPATARGRATIAAVTDAPQADPTAPRASRSGPSSAATGARRRRGHRRTTTSGSATSWPPLGAALGRPAPGLVGGLHPAGRRPAADRSRARARRRPRPRRPGAGRRRARGSSALELRVVGGPDAGRTIPLERGDARHRPGRRRARSGSTTPTCRGGTSRSRWAAGRSPSPTSAPPTAAGSTTSDSTVGRVPWPTGAVLRLGASALTVAGPAGAPAAVERGARRPAAAAPGPRLSAPAAETEVAVPAAPGAAAAPSAGLGRGRAARRRRRAHGLLLHTPTFLFFALLSPVVALGTWLSERWSGRRSGRRDAAAHAAEVVGGGGPARRRGRAPTSGRAEAALPDLAALAAAARRRTHLLWSRAARRRRRADRARRHAGPGATRVIRVEADGSRRPATAAGPAGRRRPARRPGGWPWSGPRERARGRPRRPWSPRWPPCTPPVEVELAPAHRGRPSARLGLGPVAAPPARPVRVHVRPPDGRPGRRRGPQRRPDPAGRRGSARSRALRPTVQATGPVHGRWLVVARRPVAGGPVHRHAAGRPRRRGAGALRSEHRRGRPRAGRRGPAAGRRDRRRGGAVLRRAARPPGRRTSTGCTPARPQRTRT